jgi:Leucine-rich repeat (LRR) protein
MIGVNMRKEIKEKIQTSSEHQIDLGQLDIEDNELNDITREILSARPKVQQILFSHNNITDLGASVLAKEFAELQNLTLLDLQFNQLTLKGAEHIFQLKKKNKSLQIALAGNFIHDASQLDNLEKSMNLAGR